MNERASYQWLLPVDPAVAFLFEIQSQLTGATTISELLERAVAMLERIPSVVAGWIYQRDERGTLVCVRAWETEEQQIAPLSGAELGQLLHHRWIAAHRLGRSTMEFAYPFVPSGFPDQVVAPMLLGDELIGAIAVEWASDHLPPYVPEDLAAVATVATMTAQSLQLLALRNRLTEHDQPHAVERDRRELGRVLHDGIVQDLAYIHLKLEVLERSMAADATDAEQHLREIREQITRSTTRLRTIISDLRRPRRGARGITSQLRELANGAAGQPIAQVVDLGPLEGLQLAPEIERAVIGIIREALQNIRKHANASSVRVELRLDGDELQVTVADDGAGFADPAGTAREGHFGMELMRELAEDMGGTLTIKSDVGRGTRVFARIPLIQTRQAR